MPAPRRAAFVAIGTELLRTDRVDTNSLFAARELGRAGVELAEKRVVGDDEVAIAATLVEVAGRYPIVVVSGGLGPTADDVTREATARAFGRALVRDRGLERALEAKYRARGREMPEIARKMADVIDGAEVLDNPVGTAPGHLVQGPVGEVALLPGVPREYEAMLASQLVPRWAAGNGLVVRVLRLASVYESAVEERVSHLYDRFGRERVTILGGKGLVTLILKAPSAGAGDEMVRVFAAVAGDDLYACDDRPLAAVVLEELRERNLTLALAESCTGGLLGAALTAVPGASETLRGGVVAYANEFKRDLLGVTDEVIAAHGAVSREVAESMARGALATGADCAIAVTGIAEPGGGSEAKPVGTVHIAAATPWAMRHLHMRFPGDRALVRDFAVTFGLDLLRRVLVGR